MYRLLLVDDEPEIVDWLFEMFSEVKDLDLELYKAYSARDALMWLDKVRMDVLLSDIKMPGINGLQLLEAIRGNWPKCQVIFLTGYREFDYVYTAIQNVGVRYLLKTEGDDKILGAVRNAINDLEISLRDEETVSRAKQQMERALPLLQEDFLNDLIDGFLPASEAIQERFQELLLPFCENKPLAMLLGRFDNPWPERNSSEYYRDCFAIRQIIDDYLPGNVSKAQIVKESYNILCLFQLNGEIGTEERENTWDKTFVRINGALEYIQDSCKKTLGKTISFAICEEAFMLEELPVKYSELRQLLSCKIGMGTEMILLEGNRSEGEADLALYNEGTLNELCRRLNKIRMLERLLEAGQKDEYFKTFHELCDGLIQVKSKNYNPALEIYYNVSTALLGFINNNNLVDKIMFMTGLYKLTRADEHATWNDAVDYLCKLSEAIFETMAAEGEKRASGAVDILQEYIHAHLSEDLSLPKIAGILYFNPSYLSRLFKQVTGINVSDYILNARIDKAKEHLKNSQYKVGEISALVGYESPHSFARFFRNATGMSPQEYRSSILNR